MRELFWQHECLKLKMKLKLKLIYDRQSVGQSVLVSETHLGPATNFSFSLKFSLDICGFVILYLPLWREDGSLIYCTIASGPRQTSHSWGRNPAELTAIFYGLIWVSPDLDGQVPIFISPRNRVAQSYPRALGSLFISSYGSQGYGGGILTRHQTGQWVRSNISRNTESDNLSGINTFIPIMLSYHWWANRAYNQTEQLNTH
jgi:hypothetical protein